MTRARAARRFSRREVLAWMAAAAGAAASRQGRSPTGSLRLLVHGQLPEHAQYGLEFGVREAAATAALMQRDLELGMVSAGIGEAIGVISEGPPEQDAFPDGTPIIRLRHVSPEDPGCAFRVGLSAAERQAALAAWRARKDSRAKDAELDVIEWHASLSRYGASELNDRFRKETGRGMAADAWLAWFAVKAVVESALRQSSGCDAFAAARFDGHKGRPLFFDPATLVLRQPLYVVAGDRVVDEII
jgi:hypothetical protein